MTPEECVLLTAYVEELCPNQKINENTPDAWYDVLYRYPLADCRRAVAAMVNDGKRFIDVAQIAVDTKRIRDGRLENSDLDTQPPGDVDELTYRNALRQITAQVADGQPLPFKAIEAARRGDHDPKESGGYKAMREEFDRQQRARAASAKAEKDARIAAAFAANAATRERDEANSILITLTDEESLTAYQLAREDLGPDATRDQIIIRAVQLADHTKTRPAEPITDAIRDTTAKHCRHGCEYGTHEKPCPYADRDSRVGRDPEYRR